MGTLSLNFHCPPISNAYGNEFCRAYMVLNGSFANLSAKSI